MNKNQAKGVGKVVEGSAKEIAGKATGSRLRQVEGAIEKGIGKAQIKVGNKEAEHQAKKDRKR